MRPVRFGRPTNSIFLSQDHVGKVHGEARRLPVLKAQPFNAKAGSIASIWNLMPREAIDFFLPFDRSGKAIKFQTR